MADTAAAPTINEVLNAAPASSTPAPEKVLQSMSPVDVPKAKAMNGLPSIDEIAAQFKGKSMYTPHLTKPTETDQPAAVETKPEEVAAVQAPEVKDPAVNDQAAPESVNEQPAADPVATVEEPVKEDPVAQRFAKLTQREKAQRDRDTQFQQQAQQHALKMQELEQRLDSRVKELEQREQQLKGAKRPLDVLQAAGFTYEEATKDVLGGYTPKAPDPVDEKLKPLYDRLAKLDQIEQTLQLREKELESTKNQQNLNTVNQSIKETIAKDADKYEYVAAMGDEGLDIVRQTMVDYYQSYGSMLTYEQACDQVETYYAEEVVSKLLKAKKAQDKTGKTVKPVEQQTTPTTKPQESAQPKTITNSMGQAGAKAVDIDKMTRREAQAYLAKQLKFL